MRSFLQQFRRLLKARSDPANDDAPLWNVSRPTTGTDGVIRDGHLGIRDLETRQPMPS